MSKWLKSVNTLLEQLDGQVGTASTDQESGLASRDDIGHILANRGLQPESEEEYDDDYEDDSDDLQGATDSGLDSFVSGDDSEEESEEEEEEIVLISNETPAANNPLPPPASPPLLDEPSTLLTENEPTYEDEQEDVVHEQDVVDEKPAATTDNIIMADTAESPQEEGTDAVASDEEDNKAESTLAATETRTNDKTEKTLVESLPPHSPPPKEPQATKPDATQPSSSSSLSKRSKSSNAALQKAMAEVRQLRKHVVSLNAQLEQSEHEVQAQRDELARVAERMERDRTRAAEEREDLLDDHEDELEHLKEQYEKLLQEQQTQFQQRLDETQTRLQQEEQQRLQEGGDWTKELQDALQRERDALVRLQQVQTQATQAQTQNAQLETEKKQLQTRLEAALQASQLATERERQAEDKLDATLSLQSRQNRQRQAREAELEKTVADLGAALTVLRQQRDESTTRTRVNSSDANELQEQYELAMDQVETLNAQLSLETQRCEALRQELGEISQERTEEASDAQARQQQHDRKVADLNHTISKLQATVRSLKQQQQQVSAPASDDNLLIQERAQFNQKIAQLSEQLLRQQGMTEVAKSEVLALTNRLNSAKARAEDAEKALLASSTETPKLYEMEGGGMGYTGAKLRRRVKGGLRASRLGPSSVRSIRSALKMGPGQWEGAEQVASTIDAIDTWMVETGAFMRHEPLARLGFLVYLTVLHLWAFCLVLFHQTEEEHADFGSFKDLRAHNRHQP